MNGIRYWGQALREFARRWGSYLLLMAVVSVVTAGVLVPLLRWVTAQVLMQAGIPYLGVDNFLAVITHHPWASLVLFALLILVLLLVYVQFAILLGGVDNIRRRTGLGVTQIILEGLRDLRHIRLGGFAFFVVYLLLIVPFAGVVVNSALLAKVKIPQFVIDWLGTQPVYAVLLAAFYLVMSYLGVRWLRVLPIAVLADVPLIQAARQSWRETRGRFWFYAWRLLLVSVGMALLTYGWSAGWVAVQTWADTTHFAFAAAVATLTLTLGGQLFFGGMSSVLYLLVMIAPDDVTAGRLNPPAPGRHHWLRRAVLLVGFGGTMLLVAVFGGLYMYGALSEHPLTISHRGVDAGNGVQNTIPALQATAKEKPDYVEIDLHETKDGQFVVLHDENLRQLAGLNRTPRELTLAQLERVTVRENGHSAKLASFDDYLREAELLRQKLIVELKPTAADSPQMLTHFADRYGTRLIADGDRVHSLKYGLLTRLRKRVPKTQGQLHPAVFAGVPADQACRLHGGGNHLERRLCRFGARPAPKRVGLDGERPRRYGGDAVFWRRWHHYRQPA